jgi:hypothetical protein
LNEDRQNAHAKLQALREEFEQDDAANRKRIESLHARYDTAHKPQQKSECAAIASRKKRIAK